MKTMPSSHKGFTLLELMVVVAIISIIASLSAPSFVRQIAKAKLLDAQNIASQHQAIIEEFILVNGHFPSSSEFSNLQRPLAPDSIVKSLSTSDNNGVAGTLVVTLKADTGLNEDQYFHYQRSAAQHWQCLSDLAQKLLPAHCTEVGP